MMRAKLPVFAVLLLSVPLAAADGRPVRPPAPNLSVTTTSDPRLAHLVSANVTELLACAKTSPITVKLRASFDRGGRARTVIARSKAGRAFERCVERAIRGDQSARKGASGPRAATFTIDAGPGLPTPDPRPVSALQACKVDSDCKVYFRAYGCFPGDPIGVNAAAAPAALLKAFPVKRDACGMGGPQYEQQRMANEGRWTAACQVDRCIVNDRGPRSFKLGL